MMTSDSVLPPTTTLPMSTTCSLNYQAIVLVWRFCRIWVPFPPGIPWGIKLGPLICRSDLCTWAVWTYVCIYIHLYSQNKVAMYINEQINKQTKKKGTSKKETITFNRPIHIAHYSYNHLGTLSVLLATASCFLHLNLTVEDSCSNHKLPTTHPLQSHII